MTDSSNYPTLMGQNKNDGQIARRPKSLEPKADSRFSHSPQIIFLVGMIVWRSIRRQAHGAEVRWHTGKQPAHFLRSGSNRLRLFRRHARRRDAMALAVALANQFKQMMIVHVLD